MKIRLKRICEPPEPADGLRILVERLWPRGLSKERARVDLWVRDVAPSSGLRRWFGHTLARWDEFRIRYFAELDTHAEAVDDLRERVESGPVTFVFASRETELNNAVALREYLERGAAGGESVSGTVR